MKCTSCQRKLYQGLDIFELRQGVLGPRGFISLETTVFCSDRCISQYYSDPTSEEREDEATFT